VAALATAHHDRVVRHISPAGLDDLEELLGELRHPAHAPSCIFHEDPTGLYCDVRVGTDFERMRVQTKTERRRLLSTVRTTLRR
jgi:hypothetical protein